jgi:flagellar operon protein
VDKVIAASFYVHQPTGKVGSGAASPSAQPKPGEVSFQQVLDRQLEQVPGVRFSAHAQERMATRNVNLDQVELGRVNHAVDRLAAKGGRNALVVGDQYALIVNVPSRTVITAMPRGQMHDNVVTNIDSTVFVE